MILAGMLLAMASICADVQPPTLDRGNYADTVKRVLPTAAELSWKQIPWRASFWDGVLEAQGKDKPILLWAMNGHPLACT